MSVKKGLRRNPLLSGSSHLPPAPGDDDEAVTQLRESSSAQLLNNGDEEFNNGVSEEERSDGVKKSPRRGTKEMQKNAAEESGISAIEESSIKAVTELLNINPLTEDCTRAKGHGVDQGYVPIKYSVVLPADLEAVFEEAYLETRRRDKTRPTRTNPKKNNLWQSLVTYCLSDPERREEVLRLVEATPTSHQRAVETFKRNHQQSG